MKKIIVIRGTAGCGKTTFVSALASHFARRGIHTLLISPDNKIPAFGLWSPKARPPVSLGKLLEDPLSDKATLASAVWFPYEGKENLGLLGFLPNEPFDRYSPPTENVATAFFFLALQLSDLVIVDGTSYGDMLTDTAVKSTAVQLRFVEPSPRGCLYLESLPPEKSIGKTVWAACPCHKRDPVYEAEKLLGFAFDLTVPWTEEAHDKLVEGRLLEPYHDRHYRQAVELAVRIIEGASE